MKTLLTTLLLFTIHIAYAQVLVKEKNGNYAVFKKGSKKKDFLYSTVRKNYNGYYLVQENSKWGLLNTEGERVVAPTYDSIRTAGYGYIVGKDQQYGLIDETGQFIIPLEYESIHSTSKTGGIVKKDGKWASLKNGTLNYDKENIIFTIPHNMPYYRTCVNISPDRRKMKACGDKKLLDYINKNIQYPAQAMAEGIEGMVVISFVVTDEGDIENVEILREIGGGCGEAAKALFVGQKGWTPAVHEGEPVYCQYNMPIRFKLSNR